MFSHVMTLSWLFWRLSMLRVSISTPVNLVTSVNLNIPTDLHLIKDMFYIWKLCSLLTLLHVSLKCAIGAHAHLDLSWRKPVRISNWKTFIYVCFICVSPVIKTLTFALWYRLYWFKMVFVSVISIFKHLSKSISVFLILLLPFMRILPLFLITFFNTQPVAVLLLSSPNIWQWSMPKENSHFFSFFCLDIQIDVWLFLIEIFNWW